MSGTRQRQCRHHGSHRDQHPRHARRIHRGQGRRRLRRVLAQDASSRPTAPSAQAALTGSTRTAPDWPAGRWARRATTVRRPRPPTWLRGLQVADLAPCASTLAAENGAVAPQVRGLAAVANGRRPSTSPAGQRVSYASRPPRRCLRSRTCRAGRRARHLGAGHRGREEHRHRHRDRPRRRRARLRELRRSGQAGHRDRRGVDRDLHAAGRRRDPHVLGSRRWADRRPRRHADAGPPTGRPRRATPTPAPVPQVGTLETKRVVKVSAQPVRRLGRLRGCRDMCGHAQGAHRPQGGRCARASASSLSPSASTRWLRARRSASWSS